MADAIYGLLTVILCGESGEAYNIADEASNITLKTLRRSLLIMRENRLYLKSQMLLKLPVTAKRLKLYLTAVN